MKIKIKENSGRYSLKGNCAFLDENDNVIEMDKESALEIAYTLLDYLGYDEIDKLLGE